MAIFLTLHLAGWILNIGAVCERNEQKHAFYIKRKQVYRL